MYVSINAYVYSYTRTQCKTMHMSCASDWLVCLTSVAAFYGLLDDLKGMHHVMYDRVVGGSFFFG